MAKVLYRLNSLDGEVNISFFDASTIGNSKNFEIDIPERLSHKMITIEEYNYFLDIHLFPNTVDAVLAVGDSDFIILAEGSGKKWISSFLKEKNGKWIGHRPHKIMHFYYDTQNLFWIMVGMLSAYLIAWLVGWI